MSAELLRRAAETLREHGLVALMRSDIPSALADWLGALAIFESLPYARKGFEKDYSDGRKPAEVAAAERIARAILGETP